MDIDHMEPDLLNFTASNWSLRNIGKNDVTNTSIEMPISLTVSLTFMYTFVLVFGIIGNILVIFVVFQNKDMRNSTNLFLVNLTVADLLVLIVCTPIALMEFYDKDVWYLGDGMCKFIPFLENTAAHASALTILAISMERYFAICYPLRAPAFWTNTCLLRLLTVVWVVAFLTTIPFFFMSKLRQSYNTEGSPILVCQTLIIKPWQHVYVVAIAILFLFIPFVMMLLLYGVVGKKLLYDKCALGHQTDDKSATALRSRRQVVIMLMSITVTFFVCLLPFRVFTLYLIFGSMKKFRRLGIPTKLAIVFVCRLLVYVNSAINPILYNVISTKFRKAFKQILMRYVCCKSCTSVEVSETPSPFVRVNAAYRRSISQANEQNEDQIRIVDNGGDDNENQN